MKKERVIRIRNPYLRNLRNNLRKVIIQAVSKERKRLMNEAKKYLDTDIDKHFELMRESTNLGHALNSSICQCSICGRIDKDMAYFAPFNSWHCIECDLINRGAWQAEIEYLKAHPEEW